MKLEDDEAVCGPGLELLDLSIKSCFGIGACLARRRNLRKGCVDDFYRIIHLSNDILLQLSQPEKSLLLEDLSPLVVGASGCIKQRKTEDHSRRIIRVGPFP